jgi:hypothetical protein
VPRSETPAKLARAAPSEATSARTISGDGVPEPGACSAKVVPSGPATVSVTSPVTRTVGLSATSTAMSRGVVASVQSSPARASVAGRSRTMRTAGPAAKVTSAETGTSTTAPAPDPTDPLNARRVMDPTSPSMLRSAKVATPSTVLAVVPDDVPSEALTVTARPSRSSTRLPDASTTSTCGATCP